MRALLALLAASLPAFSQVVLVPSNQGPLSFSHTVGAAANPAPQPTVITATGGPVPSTLGYRVTAPASASWLMVSPLSGPIPAAGATLRISVLPGVLPPGPYSTKLTIAAQPAGIAPPLVIEVNLTVRAAAAKLYADKKTLSFTGRSGAGALADKPILVLTDSGDPVSFTAVSSAPWLIVVPGYPGSVRSTASAQVMIRVDPSLMTIATAMTGTITISSDGITPVIANVSALIEPGDADVNSCYPDRIPERSPAQQAIVRGKEFYTGKTTVSLNGGPGGRILLPAVVDDFNQLTVTIPANKLTEAALLSLSVMNPGQSRPGTCTIQVVPPTPVISAITNTAHYALPKTGQPPELAPGSFISIFGVALGPKTAVQGLMSNGQAAMTAGSTHVELRQQGQVRRTPILFASETQVNVLLPYEALQGAAEIVLNYSGKESNPVPVNLISADPGIFTMDGTGTGQAAALNYVNGRYFANGQRTPAARESWISIYLTGTGAVSPPINSNQVTNTAMLTAQRPTVWFNNTLVDSSDAVTAPGNLPGLIQINAKVPSNVTGQVKLHIEMPNGRPSQNDVSIWVN